MVAGFCDLRNVQSAISTAYENQVLKAAHEMAGLYAIMENGTREQSSLIWPSLSKSRESFSTTLVLTNAFYLTQTREIAEEIFKNLEAIEGTIPVMLDLADNDLQRGALGALAYRLVSWRLGIANLSEHFTIRVAPAARGDRRQPADDGAHHRDAVQRHAPARARRLRAVRERAVQHVSAHRDRIGAGAVRSRC